MLKPFLRAALPAMLLGTCALPLARADIFTWTDESGRVNISNLTPPDGVRVTRVMREDKAAIAARDTAREAARESLREAEVRALAERVRQLQSEVELAKRSAPQQVESRVVPAPPIIQYFPPPEPQYAAASPPVYSGCDFGFDCGLGWGSGFYPYNVALWGSPRGRHPGRGDGRPHGPRQTFPGGGHTAPWSPISLPGAGRGRGRGH